MTKCFCYLQFLSNQYKISSTKKHMPSSDEKKKKSFLAKIGQKTKQGIHKLGETNIKLADKIENKFGKMFGIEVETIDGFITFAPPSNNTNTAKQSSLER